MQCSMRCDNQMTTVEQVSDRKQKLMVKLTKVAARNSVPRLGESLQISWAKPDLRHLKSKQLQRLAHGAYRRDGDDLQLSPAEEGAVECLAGGIELQQRRVVWY